MADPNKPEPTGHQDPVTGRFLPGNNANPKGRPKGIDFRKLVAQAHGETLEARMLAVFSALEDRALEGDVQAIKLLLDRICDPEATKLELEHSGTVPGPAMPATGSMVDQVGKLHELMIEHHKRAQGQSGDDPSGA